MGLDFGTLLTGATQLGSAALQGKRDLEARQQEAYRQALAQQLQQANLANIASSIRARQQAAQVDQGRLDLSRTESAQKAQELHQAAEAFKAKYPELKAYPDAEAIRLGEARDQSGLIQGRSAGASANEKRLEDQAAKAAKITNAVGQANWMLGQGVPDQVVLQNLANRADLQGLAWGDLQNALSKAKAERTQLQGSQARAKKAAQPTGAFAQMLRQFGGDSMAADTMSSASPQQTITPALQSATQGDTTQAGEYNAARQMVEGLDPQAQRQALLSAGYSAHDIRIILGH